MAAVAVLALAAPACSDSNESSSIEILHWWKQGGEAEAIGALLDYFKQQYPGVAIVDSSVDGSSLARAAIRSKISDGIPPDTFQANGGWDLMGWVLYNNHDAGQSYMQELPASALEWTQYVPEPVLQSVSYNGKVYAVPLNIHRVNTFFYNKKVFEDVGIHADQLTTLDDLFDAAEAVKQYNLSKQQLDPTTPPITPIAMGFKQTEGDMATDDTWTLALAFFENILVARMGGDQYAAYFADPKPGNDAMEQLMASALADFRKLVSYSNVDASALTWAEPLDMVLRGDAAMTIMGDWGKGYANSMDFDAKTFGAMPTPGTAGTFVFTTDTFGLTLGSTHVNDTLNLLNVFGSRDGQDIFNPIKGSISARTDSQIMNGKYDDMAKQTFDDFVNANKVPATSILAPQTYLDAIGKALAEFAKTRENGDATGNASIVQHTLDNYADVLLASCWPKPAANCH
ncbi:MAG TPA: ABC transporter substrate-binding protein [Polyangia bacterium]|nr:ABC transporter substrate-binding protein [Polyangia bacterium]